MSGVNTICETCLHMFRYGRIKNKTKKKKQKKNKKNDISRHAMCPGLVYTCLKFLHVRIKVPTDAKRHVTATQTSRKPCVGIAIILKLQKKLY